MNKTPIYYESEKRMSDTFQPNDKNYHKPVYPSTEPITRYPHIESIRIISHTDTPSATIKIRRRRSNTGGPFVTRTYQVYDIRWVMIWQAAQVSLFKIQYAGG